MFKTASRGTPGCANLLTQKKRGKGKNGKRCSQSCTPCFPSRLHPNFLSSRFFFPPLVRSITRRCSCMKACVSPGVGVYVEGRSQRLRVGVGEQIFLVAGLNPVFSSRLGSCACARVQPSAARGRHAPTPRAVRIMAAPCVAAAYHHLVRGEDRVVITTSSSAKG